MARRRLDSELVRRGLVLSADEAETAVRDGLVTVGGRPALKASTLVSPEEALSVGAPRPRFVSRGGEKLDAALDRFGIDVRGRDGLDAGASTGGFTHCLLHRGAARVLAVDVSYGQIDWTLRQDPRVRVIERTNVRALTAEDLPFAPDVVVADLSFISLRTVLPALVDVGRDRADLVLLVKPQFEALPRDVEEGGVVRDAAVWRRVLTAVAGATERSGAGPRGAVASQLPGPAGNVEFFLHAVKGGPGRPLDVDAAVEEGLALGARP